MGKQEENVKFVYEKPALEEFNPLYAAVNGESCPVAPALVPPTCVDPLPQI